MNIVHKNKNDKRDGIVSFFVMRGSNNIKHDKHK